MKKNIAIIVPTLSGGGAERVASNITLTLDNKKYNKMLVVYSDEKIEYPYKAKLLSLDSTVNSSVFGKVINVFKRIQKLKAIKKDHKFDVSVSFLSSPNIINLLSKKNEKIVLSVRNYPSKSNIGLLGKLDNYFIKKYYNKADSIIAVSNLIKKNLIEDYGIKDEKVKVIYNPYDVSWIKSKMNEDIEEDYRETFNFPTIITVGRLTEQKGQWYLLRSFAKLKEQIPEARLVILGVGELKGYLTNLCKQLVINDSVTFLGFQENPFKYISRSQVYVSTSLFEGFPNALCEAMACGLPIISSDCFSGPKEILSPNSSLDTKVKGIKYAEYGVLIEDFDGEKKKYNEPLTQQEKYLTEAMLQILTSSTLYEKYSMLSDKRVKDFSKELIISNWEEEIKELING